MIKIPGGDKSKICLLQEEARELKDKIIAECETLGASVAKVSLSHGINANIVQGWRKQAGRVAPAIARPEFVPVAVASIAQAKLEGCTAEL